MPTDLIFTAKGLSDQEKRKILLEKLRSEYNPFDNSVVRTSVSEQSLELTVPEYNASQMADLTEIIEKYRSGTQGTQGIPIIGQVGAGKTQLLYQLRDHLRNKALQEGQETLFIIVPRLTEGIDALNFLLFLVANHLLEKNADSTRLRNKIAEEITKRVLRETLNSLPDAKKVELFPTTGGGGFSTRLSVSGVKITYRIGSSESGRSANFVMIREPLSNKFVRLVQQTNSILRIFLRSFRNILRKTNRVPRRV